MSVIDRLSGGRCLLCGSARLIAYDGSGLPLVRCEACGLAANATDSCSPLPLKVTTKQGQVRDWKKALSFAIREAVTDAGFAAERAVEAAFQDIERELIDELEKAG